MLKHSLLASTLVLFAACGGPPADLSDDLDDAAIDSRVEQAMDDGFEPLPPTASQEDMFTGRWQIRNPDTGELMARWELRVENSRWVGQYTLTEQFCQSRDDSRDSACPFEGQGGSWEFILASDGALMAQATDPFQSDAMFTLNMLAPDAEAVTRAAISADVGFVSLNTDIERGPS